MNNIHVLFVLLGIWHTNAIYLTAFLLYTQVQVYHFILSISGVHFKNEATVISYCLDNKFEPLTVRGKKIMSRLILHIG